MALKPISVARYWEMVKIEEERTAVYDGMLMLRSVFAHLRDDVDFASSPESASAKDLLLPLMGQMESQNKALGVAAATLWEQILEVDSAQLTSGEIEHQQNDAASGIDWIQRTMKHLDTIVLEPDDKGEIITALMEVCSDLNLESHRLRESQRKHQRLQAEKLALQALGTAS